MRNKLHYDIHHHNTIKDKIDDVHKAKQLLNDTSPHRLQHMDLTRKLETKINNSLKRLQDMQRTTREEQRRMRLDASNNKQYYGLLQRKEVIPLKPIIPLPGVLKYNLPEELWRGLKSTNRRHQDCTRWRYALVRRHRAPYFNRFEIGGENAARTSTKHQPDNPLEEPTICSGAYFGFEGVTYEQIKRMPME